MALSTSHGATTLFTSEWNDAVFALKYPDSTVDHAYPLYLRYTTGTGTTMFVEAGPYTATVTNTSRAIPMFTVTVPPWVQPSKVDVTISTWACSSAAANTCWIIGYGGHPPTSYGGIELPLTGETVKNNDGVIFAFPACSSGYGTFTTQMSIAGGQAITICSLTTSLVLLRVSSFKMTGTTVANLTPSSIWSTSLITTY